LADAPHRSADSSHSGGAARVVQLFPTCLVNDLFPEVGIAAVEVLERNGVAVEVPAGLTCCGQPAFNAGFRVEAKAVARRTVEILSKTDGPIVIPSGSCGDMLVHQMAELFREEPEFLPKVNQVAARCRELTQFLCELPTITIRRRFTSAEMHGDPEKVAAARRMKVAYHPSCHLARGLRVVEPPLKILRVQRDLELVPVADQEECCGFGGMFSVKEPEISGAMLDRKCRALEKSGAEIVASCDSGCLLHLAGGMRRRGMKLRTCHVAELLNGTVGRSP
jgi:L-lactate dehydrogenase complex protein LldE